MKFYIAHIQILQTTQKKIVPKEYLGKPIVLAEELLQKHPKYVPRKKKGYTSLVFDNFVTDKNDGRLLAALVGKDITRDVPKHGEKGYYRKKDDQSPYVFVLWDRNEQLILIERNHSAFPKYENVFNAIEDHLNDLLDRYEYRVYIEPQTEEIFFWNAVRKYKFIYEVNFELHMPNLLGKTHADLAKALDEGKDFNATSVGYNISNPDGNIVVPYRNPIIEVALDWIADGGGWWSIRGKRSKDGKPETVSSKKSENYRTEEIVVDPDTLSPEVIQSTLSEVRHQTTVRRNRDEDDDESRQDYIFNP